MLPRPTHAGRCPMLLPAGRSARHEGARHRKPPPVPPRREALAQVAASVDSEESSADAAGALPEWTIQRSTLEKLPVEMVEEPCDSLLAPALLARVLALDDWSASRLVTGVALLESDAVLLRRQQMVFGRPLS
mmetsp:Transcript_4126/g.15955  ORF Transcript_4126/g.15955 Transcript_4126/m.15955 type:complete len:133 (-) Transcript_4126:1081-1479(-)